MGGVCFVLASLWLSGPGAFELSVDWNQWRMPRSKVPSAAMPCDVSAHCVSVSGGAAGSMHAQDAVCVPWAPYENYLPPLGRRSDLVRRGLVDTRRQRPADATEVKCTAPIPRSLDSSGHTRRNFGRSLPARPVVVSASTRATSQWVTRLTFSQNSYPHTVTMHAASSTVIRHTHKAITSASLATSEVARHNSFR